MHLESLRAILALAAIRDLDVIQFDITSAHLHGTLKEEVHIEKPEGHVCSWEGRLGVAAYEGLIRVSAGWENVECGAKHSRGGSGIHSKARGSSDVRLEFLDRLRLRGSRLLGGRLRRNRLEDGAQCSCEECRRIIQHHRFRGSSMGTRHVARARPPCTHDLEI